MAVQFLCSKCGSTNVISDARAKWDVKRQQWIVIGHYDSSECGDCEQENTAVEVELAPVST